MMIGDDGEMTRKVSAGVETGGSWELESKEQGICDITPPSRNSSSPAHKKPSSSKKKTADDFQSPGRFYDELPNTADYVSYRLACNKEDYLEQHSPPIQPPLTFLPQNPYTHHSNQTAIFTYPTPSGPISSYTFPKEQYV
ncbi:hypothetical protein DPX16_13300 [Anabarilius grahami]|uniref:Uncharacterized protein n=1 Tax=Anabarilius grahami TaxID=495550 RepID=A0A3N0YMZ3_ANAGA|nr:hypothetical protein DPX16_13300 [Anabarilius grahami]